MAANATEKLLRSRRRWVEGRIVERRNIRLYDGDICVTRTERERE